MRTDDYGEVINGPETYKDIATELQGGHSVLIGWTDQASTHYDVLFTRGALKYGTIQGGLQRGDLFVSVMRIGAFGFEVHAGPSLHPSYVSEKLFIHNLVTATALTELIEGVKGQL